MERRIKRGKTLSNYTKSNVAAIKKEKIMDISKSVLNLMTYHDLHSSITRDENYSNYTLYISSENAFQNKDVCNHHYFHSKNINDLFKIIQKFTLASLTINVSLFVPNSTSDFGK